MTTVRVWKPLRASNVYEGNTWLLGLHDYRHAGLPVGVTSNESRLGLPVMSRPGSMTAVMVAYQSVSRVTT